jgi:two-component system nitrogen regulation response regulator NtrX
MAVRAVKLGAFDFLEKPLSLDKVLTVCRNALTVQNLREENRYLKKNRPQGDNFIGHSPAIEKIRELIRQAAASDARILISGENGTGKELAARAIHQLSSRADKACVEVNCAALPDTLIETELFGHEKGAFTDAVSARKGRFEMADQGTLFLDEIGDMSLTAQAKVLRAIQEQKIERIGGERTIDTDVRIVAATNKDLSKECQTGRFRQDLFFRLNVIPIHIPPLRERTDDIVLMLHHFLNELGIEKPELEEGALKLLGSYPWPGNVRELKNLAERIAVMNDGKVLKPEFLRGLLQISAKAPEEGLFGNGEKDKNQEQNTLQNQLSVDILNQGYIEARESFEKCYLEYHLSQNDGIIAKAAEAIGIYPSNLHAKLRKYGLRTRR